MRSAPFFLTQAVCEIIKYPPPRNFAKKAFAISRARYYNKVRYERQ